MRPVFAIDPGTTESGWVMLTQDARVHGSGVVPNWQILRMMTTWADGIAIERFEARGMSLGDESIVTILWTGRFIQAAASRDFGGDAEMVRRSEVKSHLCGTQKAKDTNVRAALIDIFGPPGVKAKPGGTYGVKSHAWAALGVAATVRKLEPRGNA